MSDKFKYNPKTGDSQLDYERKRDGRRVTITTPGKKDNGGSWFDRLFKKGRK